MQASPPGACSRWSLPEACGLRDLTLALGPGLSLAAVNGPLRAVRLVAGAETAIASSLAWRRLATRDVACRTLLRPRHASHAFHSVMMEPAIDDRCMAELRWVPCPRLRRFRSYRT